MSNEYSMRLRDFIRGQIGDQGAEDLLTDTQIDSFIEGRVVYGNPQTERLICYSSKFRSSFARPVHELTVSAALSVDHIYRIDESTKVIQYVSGGVAPGDRDEITITYFDVKFSMIMADCFEFLASATAKMATRQSVGGMSVDATNLSKEFKTKSEYWACKDQW